MRVKGTKIPEKIELFRDEFGSVVVAFDNSELVKH